MQQVNYRAVGLHGDVRTMADLDAVPLDAVLLATHGGFRVGPELWGGVECTVNRVEERYSDQLELNGHAGRIEDLDRFAELGIRAIRYPVLWERTAPEGPRRADWTWADARLGRLARLGVRPIVGLVHHGSGPRYTSLMDPAFPEKLAEYAGAVAERYPWVDAYTPVNEILTTARFSGLYGHWFPHGRDEATFARVLLHECRGTILAMRAIRAVNPGALLIQTDDLGKTFSTPELAAQAEFDNARRWLGWDLLCGRVDRDHPLRNYLLYSGVEPAELEWFLENPCPPDILGVNYYITSERFLDHRLERYPESVHGGNGRQQYADVETVRVCAQGIAGLQTLLRDAWERYRIPIAVTEAHLGCTREEQLRWLRDIWQAAQDAWKSGIDLRAVTVWSLLGAYDWNSLLTRRDGHYEPGVFDLRGGQLRPTALAALMRDLAAGRESSHPALPGPGWWQRPERLLYPAVHVDTGASTPERTGGGSGSRPRWQRSAPRPLLITGASGSLGSAFARLCDVRGLTCRPLRRRDLDIAVPFAVDDVLDDARPWAVINAAGYSRIDDAEEDEERCLQENAAGARVLAAACARRGIPLVTFSSDMVFDGTHGSPCLEGHPTAPLSIYGRSKAEGERLVLEAHPSALVIRTSPFFSPWDDGHFIAGVLRNLAAGRPVAAIEDTVLSPTFIPDLVNGALDLLIDGETGLWHLANRGAVTWLELAQMAAEKAGFESALVEGRSAASFGLRAARPRYSVLGSERGEILPTLDDALERYLRLRGPAKASVAPQRRTSRRAALGATA